MSAPLRATAILVSALLSVGANALAQTPASTDVLTRAMSDELARSMAQLRLDTLQKPYFIAYRVDEFDRIAATASLGGLVRSQQGRTRRLEVEVRVGDYAFDNTNFFGMPEGGFSMLRGFGLSDALPLDDDYQVIRRQLWLATDQAYKAAVEELSQKRAALQNQTAAEQVPDFSRESVVTNADVTPAPRMDRGDVESLVRALSALFREMPEISRSQVTWNGVVRRTRYVNSEGTTFERISPWVALHVDASTQASDGMPLADVLDLFGGGPADLPSREALADSVRALADRLSRLRRAAAAEAYDGPVLFEGAASAQLFDEILAPRLLGSRRPISGNPMFEQFAAQLDNPFVNQIGRRVLAPFLSVTDDPTLAVYEGHFLGGYRVDDDGVPARATTVVDHGTLKTLLTTRVPVRGVAHSTGNRWGAEPTIGTLMIATDSGLSDGELRRRLVEAAKARGDAYGVVIRRLARPDLASFDDPMAFMMGMAGEMRGGAPTLVATLAYKIYPDGREELIRNANITGVTAATFKSIAGASASRSVYTAGSFETPGEMLSAFARFPLGGMQGLGEADLEHARSYVVPAVLFDDVSLQRPTGAAPTLPLTTPPWIGHHVQRSP